MQQKGQSRHFYIMRISNFKAELVAFKPVSRFGKVFAMLLSDEYFIVLYACDRCKVKLSALYFIRTLLQLP